MLPISPLARGVFLSPSTLCQTGRLQLSVRAATLFVPVFIVLAAALRPAMGAEPGRVTYNVPLSFEENRGQAPAAFRYIVRYNGSEALFSAGSIDFKPAGSKLRGGSIRMRLQNAKATPGAEGLLEGRSNYLIGADASKWVRGVPHFRRVEYEHLYPGISLTFYGNGNSLEHDFQVAPGADASQISFRLDGAEGVSLSDEGDLEVRADGQILTLRKPAAYQMTANGRTAIEAGFVLGRDETVSFRVGAYDRTRMLVIDPVLVFSTYLGGATGSDVAAAVTTDASGNIYLTGSTSSLDFPTENPLQPYMGGCDPFAGCMNAFITKLNPSGTELIYSTYLGGSAQDQGGSIVVDGNGDAIVAGFARSSNFPKAGAIESPACQVNNACFFLSSLKPDGSGLNYSGMIGGSGLDTNGIFGYVAVDKAGSAYLTGYTSDPNFQITSGTLARSVTGYPYTQLFILKVDATGKLLYSTVVPGNATQDPATNNNQFIPAGIAVDTLGQVTVAGFAGVGLPSTKGVIQATFPYDTTNIEDPTAGFVLQISAKASAINFASYLPGANSANAMTVDSNGDLFFAGWTNQTDLPVSSNAYQKAPASTSSYPDGFFSGYILELNPHAAGVVAATYLDGTAPNINESSDFTGIALDSKGDIFVGGETDSPDFPLQDPFTTVPEFAGSVDDMVLAAVNPSMSALLFGSFLDTPDNFYGGSTFSGIAIDSSDKLIVAGATGSRNFPTTVGSFEPELPPVTEANSSGAHIFIAKIDMATAAPSACLSSVKLDFGGVAAGSSATQTLNVTNCGNAPLNVTSIVSSSPTITASQSCQSIAAGSVCPVTLKFTPVGNGSVSGTLTYTDNAVLPPPVVSFTGFGQAPQIVARPSSVVFPAQVLGVSASGTAITVSVQNLGYGPLVVNPVGTEATGDFSITSDSCTAPPVGEYCEIQVSFTPSKLGPSYGTLNIASNDPANPVLSVGLSGTALAAYPVATISLLLNPSYPVTTGTTPISATVEGTNFFPSSVVYVNGVAQATTFQNSGDLSFTLSPAQLSAMGEFPVTVVNPSPGGGISAAFPLNVYLSIPLQSSSLVVDPVGGLLYAAIPASATQNPSTVIPINPATGATMTPIAVSSDPQLLAVSSDGTELYVATSAGVLQRINLKTLAIEKTFKLPVDAEWGQTYAHEMQVVPGSPKSIVVELFAQVDPAEDGAALYNDSGLVNWLPGVGSNHNDNMLMLDSFTFATPNTIYGLPEGSSFFAEINVGSGGLSIINPSGGTCCDETTGSELASDGTLLYTNSGEVWNPVTRKLLGTYLETNGSQLFYVGKPVPDTANKHTYFLDGEGRYADYEGLNIEVYDQSNYGLTGSVPFFDANFNGTTDLARWGSNGFAFRSYDASGINLAADQIIVLTTSKVTSNTGAPVPILTSVSPPSVYAGGPAFTLQLSGNGFTSASTVLINGNQRSTTFVSGSLLIAQVPASDIAANGYLNVQVNTPAPGGGTSDYDQFSINTQRPVVAITPASSNPIKMQALDVSVSVSGAKGYPTPTGEVFISSLIYSPPAVVLSNGSATFHFPAGSLPVGTDTLTAVYAPDSASIALYNGANGVKTVTVSELKPTVSETLSSSSITTTQSLTVTTVVSGGSGKPTPTGSVTLSSGKYASAAATLVNGGATISIAPGLLTAGIDTLTATYAPDDSSSATYGTAYATRAITVVKVTPRIAWPASDPIAYGTELSSKQLDAAVKYDGKAVPGKPVYSPPEGTVPAAGWHDLMVTFMPENSAEFNKAAASSRLLVNKAKPAVILTVSARSVGFGKPVTFSAKVTAVGHGAAPSGTVTFLSGTTLLGRGTLSKGVAQFTTAKLSIGKHNIAARYSGNANYVVANSGLQSITVLSKSTSAKLTLRAPAE